MTGGSNWSCRLFGRRGRTRTGTRRRDDRGVLSLLKDTDDWFPKVLAAVRDHLRPVNPERTVLDGFHREEGANEPLTTRFPRETLDLLDRVAPSGSQDVPYGLTDVLGLLVEAEPALVGDRRYTRLDAHAAQR